MKNKIIWLTLCALLAVSLLPLTALAADTSPADGYNDHDYSVLRAYLETEVSGTKNGLRVSTGYNAADPETWAVSWVDFGGEKYAYSINWQDSGLTGALDFSGFVHVAGIYLSANRLSSIVTTNCAELIYFECANVGLTSLDLSTNTSLIRLDCSENELTSLNTSAAGTNLLKLWCYQNELTTLNISGNTAMDELDCDDNHLTSLDVTGHDALTVLNCSENQLSSLNIGDCVLLQYLECYENQLSELDLSKNTALASLDCGSNLLTSLDVSALTLLMDLICNDNQLTDIDLAGLTKLIVLVCEKNRLSSLNYSDCPLVYLGCGDNALTSIDVSGLAGLMMLECSNNNIGSLNVSGNITLASLECNGCGLAELDLSANTELYSVSCADNELAALNLSGLTELGSLDCSDNAITTLNTTECVMYFLDATGNPLTSITAVLYSGNITLTAEGDGFVGLFYEEEDFFVAATPDAAGHAAFLNWTNASGDEVSTMAKTNLSSGNYDLTANFFSLASSDADGKIFTAGRVTLTPSVTGGTWSFDSAYFSRDGGTFTALKAGTSSITYTVGGASIVYTVTIEASGLPSTGQSFAWVWICAGAALALAAGVVFGMRKRAAITK